MGSQEEMSKVATLYKTMDYGPSPESPAMAQAWLEAHDRQFGLFIQGKWTAPHPAKYFPTMNPAVAATAKPLAKIAQAGKQDVDAAVRAAKQAQVKWWKLGGHGRARYLYAIAREIQKQARLFAVLESLDNGKPIRESRDIDIPLVARHFYHHAGWAQLMESEFPGYTPVGVIGQIIPWNFPLLMLAWKIAPALAMGNTVVLKPAEFTSLTALRFAEVCRDINLPAGVVNIVTGDGAVGEMLTKHKDVQKIAFTGSTEVGRLIRKTTAGSGKKLSLELGGKSPFIVFDDADLDSVVEGVVDAIWFNQGQVCCAGSRLLVQEGVAPRLYEKLKSRMDKLKVGDPLDKGVDIGAIIAPVQLQKITELVEQGRKEGATMWQPGWACPNEGCFYPPTLFTEVAPASTIAQVEIFGPVLVAMTFRTPAEAVRLANNTRYGLAASVWTENINLALDIAPQVKAGTVWVNSTNLFDAAAGFGGYRESGFGREGGREGLWEYIKSPTVPSNDHKLGKFALRNKAAAVAEATNGKSTVSGDALPTINRTAKLYIGGKQARPDSGYSRVIYDHRGKIMGEVGEANRKDVRNAVEAAHAAAGWSKQTAHARAQIIYYIAENLDARSSEFSQRISLLTGVNKLQSEQEVQRSIETLFTWAAWADKHDGHVHHTPLRNVTIAMPEALGVIGVICDDPLPLLGFIAATIPAVALGNTVVAVASEAYPLLATDFYQVLETSDLPAGVLNILTGSQQALSESLAGHDDVDGLWNFAKSGDAAKVESLAASNMKRTWLSPSRHWLKSEAHLAKEFFYHATEIKNIWVPYGE